MVQLAAALLALLCVSTHLSAKIHALFTSALLETQFEERKEEYIRNISQFRSFGLDPWIIEAMHVNSSFFDEITTQVLYPQKNNAALRNKGVNETMSIRASLPFLPFEDEDIVVKVTGRYFLKDDSFLKYIESTSDDFDVWGVFGRHYNQPGDLFTGCFAMRWKYLKQIISEMDLEKAEIDYIAVEILFGRFIRDNHLRVKEMDSLHVKARVFYDGCNATYYDF